MRYDFLMKFVYTIALIVVFGSGCAGTSISPSPSPSSASAIDLLRNASLLDGPQAVAVDAQTGRRFTSILPPTFRDENGHYTTQTPGEEIRVQIAVGGTMESDRERFLNLPSVTRLDEDMLGAWSIVAVREDKLERTVIRATQADVHDPAMYHVVECLSAPRSLSGFWDACRTMIEAAHIDQSTQTPN
jgi:hypothetical protein